MRNSTIVTQGFANHHGTYVHHGCIKSVFVRPLRPDATNRLADPYVQTELKPKVSSMKPSENAAETLHKALLTIPDCRMARGIRHNKLAILSIAICAVLCGAKSFEAMAAWGQACTQKTRKRLRCRKDAKTGQVKLLSVFLAHQGAVLAQQEIRATTNEIPVIKELLATSPPSGAGNATAKG